LNHLFCRVEGEDERWLNRLCRFGMAGEAVFLLARVLADRSEAPVVLLCAV